MCVNPTTHQDSVIVLSSINKMHTVMRENISNVVGFSNFLTASRVDLSWSESKNVARYRDRIEELKDAVKEEDIESPNDSSLHYFFTFLDLFDFDVRRGALFLLDDGTCAAMWKNSEWRLDLTFNVDGRVDCSCLDRRKNQPDGKTRQGSIQDIHDFISEHDLISLFQ